MSVLIIPIDASQLGERERGDQKVKVAVQGKQGVTAEVITLQARQAEVKLEVDQNQPLTVAIGPAEASDEDILHLQTLTTRVSPNQWRGADSLRIDPLVITPFWWRQWRRWCRDFTVQGRVLCADGSPVPGAEVRAYDVDYFWWWSSVLQTGPSAVTDANGHFTIKFRWCCGWWPWWWWRLRAWRLEPLLIEKIDPVLRMNPNLRVPRPDPTPTLDLLSNLAPQPFPPGPPPLSPAMAIRREIDPSVIPNLRQRLISALPRVPELERLRIWPWWPWTPWFDCAPDLIFRVTQNCGGSEVKVIVNENIFQTRWDVPTTLDVTLIANSEACCIPPPDDQPQGDCAVLTQVCGIPVTSIGGNSGAPAAPVGYADPGGRDRPFAGVINLSGLFGSSAQADFYEIEYSPHGAAAWAPVPEAALRDFTRGYFDATQPWPNQWFYPAFPVKTFGSKHVYESRKHYEDTHPPPNWGTAFGRAWFLNADLVASLQTDGIFSDGAYDFRIVGYQADAGGELDPSTRKEMDGCGGQQNNQLVVRLDNRIVGPSVPGTVHVNTTEPDCGILAVRLGSTSVQPCGAEQLEPGTAFEVDFFATDPDGHLDHYELVVKYDLGSIKNLLSAADVGAFSLTPISGGPQGPDYAEAVTLPQTAARPIWNGGTMRLHVNNASLVFPKTCCYLVELTVWKRNISNCNGSLTYYNQIHHSFTVTV